ncbi:zinc ABC transporter substrate-binding protein [Magnetovibrio sp.]|uniref:zinc ABC transporter substrate-binding protein n=1 Tax=Magnetovibrio sp. TaxID=2024836 RepID=UPI002F926A59
MFKPRFVRPFPSSVPALLIAAILTLGLAPTSTLAAPPTVATSIKPVQALVKMVMGSLGDPELVIPATASPHMFALKPSQATTLEQADVVFWIGPDMETTLIGPLDKMAANARVVELMKTPGLRLIHFDEEAQNDDGHAHGNVDPHIWLAPSNGRKMISYIAEVLSEIDPPNADTYAKNAKKARQRITILSRKTMDYVVQMRYTPYLVQHDGYGYLALEFGMNEVGHIQTTPGREPGAKHVADIIELIKSKNVKCLMHEPQFAPKLAERLKQETGIALREIDPMGIHLSLSDTTYVRIIQGIIVSMEPCLQPRAPKQPAQPAPTQ